MEGSSVVQSRSGHRVTRPLADWIPTDDAMFLGPSSRGYPSREGVSRGLVGPKTRMKESSGLPLGFWTIYSIAPRVVLCTGYTVEWWTEQEGSE